MIDFTFEVPTRILFGKNRVEELAFEIEKYSNKILLAYGGGSIKDSGLYSRVVSILNENNIEFVELTGIQPNPRLTSVHEGIRLCREHHLDFILSVGGGSVLDCCKAIAAGVPYSGDVWDFTQGLAEVQSPLPLGCILTLAATGSEMNGNAVISKEDTKEKRPIKSDFLRPAFSILEPSLTFTVNKYQTAAGTVDIMSHIFEQYFAPESTAYLQDSIAEGILKTCIKYGPIAIDDPNNYEARANLLWASSLALNGLTGSGKSGDWSTHIIEHELSALHDVTHGAGLAVVFPSWMNYLMNENLNKFVTFAKNVWNIYGQEDETTAKMGIQATRDFFSSLGMPATLKELGISEKDIPGMAKQATINGDLGTLRKLDVQDVENILKLCL